jgi:hypothetical protein
MALIKCAECGKEISSAAASCPGCGHPVNQPPPDPATAAVLAFVLARARWNASMSDYLRNAAVVQAALVVARAVAWWVAGREPMFGPTGYAQFFLWFALGWYADRPFSIASTRRPDEDLIVRGTSGPNYPGRALCSRRLPLTTK